MGGSITNCPACGGFMHVGSKCGNCHPEVLIEKQVTDEPFDETLARSKKVEDRVRESLLRSGRWAIPIPHVDGRPDQGDLLVWDDIAGIKENIRTVDAKQAFQWRSGEFPFRHIMLTAESEIHPDWVYVITDTRMTQAAVVDMRKVPDHMVLFKPTQNRRGGNQRSAQVAVAYAKFCPIHAISF